MRGHRNAVPMPVFLLLFVVKAGVEEVDVFLVHPAFGQLQGLAEALEVDDFPLPQEANPRLEL